MIRSFFCLHRFEFRRLTAEGRGRWRCKKCGKWETGGVPCPVPTTGTERDK